MPGQACENRERPVLKRATHKVWYKSGKNPAGDALPGEHADKHAANQQTISSERVQLVERRDGAGVDVHMRSSRGGNY